MEALGIHRSLEPRGVLPQQAERLLVSGPLRPTEAEIEIDYLNVDAASWHEIRTAAGGSAEAMKRRILDIVATRGKLHNPVTGSGGMLVGTVAALGDRRTEPEVGTRIATLVSLTLTPLVLDRIGWLDPGLEQVRVAGRAILFEASAYARLPPDLPETVALAILDVAGAPAWTARLAQPGMNVVVIGAGGKSGSLACAQAARLVGARGRVVGLCWPPRTADAAAAAGARAIAVDCTDPVAVLEAVEHELGGDRADLVLSCANVSGCEGGAILACRDDGRVVFFSMATSFAAAALVAEGAGRTCELTIGNGYVPGHADLALDLVRTDPALLERFGAMIRS